MTMLASWLSPALLRLLALALLHFLWQGMTIATFAYLAMALCRSASSRYALGVAALLLMLAAPVFTFFLIRTREQARPAVVAVDDQISSVDAASAQMFKTAGRFPSPQDTVPPYFLWLVEAWLAGVVLLSLRSAGGFLVVERLRRRETLALEEELLQMCLSLQRRMGLTRMVRYCESIHLDAPAVAGWLRPAVLLPVSALSGLSDQQIEAVIAHELAHIRRFDAIVNHFQVAVETLLFYHPAVWWLGKRIRAEREHCCDDVAVEVCGSPVTYAHALTLMAEWKAAPEFAMAANGSPLVERIARLLGARQVTSSYRSASLSAGVLCLCAALLAGSGFVGGIHRVQAQTPVPALAPTPAAAATLVQRAPVLEVPEDAASMPDEKPAPAPAPAPAAAPEPQSAPAAPKQSYIDSLREVGLTNLSVEELIGLKVQGVTADYVKGMTDQGLKPSVNELIGMKVQGITPEYVKEMRATTGESLGVNDLIGLKVQGVSPEYVKQMHDLGLNTAAGELIGMKVQGVTPEYVRQMRDLSLKVDTESLIGMKVQGVTPAYVKEMQDAGFKVNAHEVIAAKVQGITPEFIANARSHGFKDLTLEKLIGLKASGVLDAAK